MPSLRRSHLALILTLLLPGPAAAGVWVPAGPEGGAVTSVVLDPSDPQVLYAAARYGGVLKSLSSGAAWSPANEGIQRIQDVGVLCLAADPSHPERMYAGTLQGTVFRSDDGGAHWSGPSIGIADVIAVIALVVAPDAVYAIAGEEGNDLANQVYKSTDRGESWSPLAMAQVAALSVDPADPHRLYAVLSGRGVYRSTDGGATWAASTQGLPKHGSVTALVAVPGAGSTAVYVAVEGHGLFRSTDGGDHWQRVSRGGLGGAKVVDLVAGPPSTLYAVTEQETRPGHSLLRSTDGGGDWQPAGQGLPADFLALAADPRGTAVYAGSATAGVFRSADAGATWSASNHGLRARPAGSALADPRRPGIAYLTLLSQAGLWKTVDGGASWRETGGLTGSPQLLAIDPQHPATLYLSDQSLLRSRNGGRAWEALGPPAKLLAVDPGQPAVLYRYSAYPRQVDRSTDGGKTWALDFTPPCDVISLTVVPSADAFVGMLCNGAGPPLYRRRQNGWRPVRAGLPAQLDRAWVAADPRQPSTVYVGVFIYGGPPGSGFISQTFRSTDGGTSWELLPDLASGPATSFAFPAGRPEVVYAYLLADTVSDVFESDDGGRSWGLAGPGLTGTLFVSLAADPTTVYATTPGGLYKLVSDPP
jgi:photosystem II stability/assembly factor-like uncharacterized protein